MPKLNEIEDFFKTAVLPETLQICPGVKSINVRKTVDAEIMTLRSNPGNRIYLPAWERLVIMYEKIKAMQ